MRHALKYEKERTCEMLGLTKIFVLGKFMRKQMKRKLGLYEFLGIINTLFKLFEHFL